MKPFPQFLIEKLEYFQNGVDKVSSNKWRPLFKSTTRFELRILYIPRIKTLVAFEPFFLHEVAASNIASQGLQGKQVVENGDFLSAGHAFMVKNPETSRKDYRIFIDHAYEVEQTVNKEGRVMSARARITGDSHITSAKGKEIKKQAFAYINDSELLMKYVNGTDLEIKTKGYDEAFMLFWKKDTGKLE